MEKNFKGRVLIDDIYDTLRTAVCNVMIAKEIDHVKAFKEYGVSRVDLHGLITNRGNKMPLARLFMFAADLGIAVNLQVKEPEHEPARPEPKRKRKDSEREPDFEPEFEPEPDSEFEDEPVRAAKPKRKKRT